MGSARGPDRPWSLDAEHLEDARHEIDRVVILVAQFAIPGGCARPAPADGQEMMHGSAVPPSNSYRFHILNGVLNAIAQPFG